VIAVCTLSSEHCWAQSSISKRGLGKVQSWCKQFKCSHVQDKLFNPALSLADEHSWARVWWHSNRCRSHWASTTHCIVYKHWLGKRWTARACNLDDRWTQIANKLQFQQHIIMFTLQTQRNHIKSTAYSVEITADTLCQLFSPFTLGGLCVAHFRWATESVWLRMINVSLSTSKAILEIVLEIRTAKLHIISSYVSLVSEVHVKSFTSSKWNCMSVWVR